MGGYRIQQEAGIDEVKIGKTLDDAAKISDRIWQRAAHLSRESSTVVPYNLMLNRTLVPRETQGGAIDVI